jgi:hypothetical protein
MRLVGFKLNKINIEKLNESVEKLKIDTKIDISEMKETKHDFFNNKEQILEIYFKYNINYDPEFAKIELKGSVMLAIEPKLVREILRQWSDKKMSEDFKVLLFNIILRKCSLKALQLEDEMNLPPHISLPLLKKPESEEKRQDNQ